MHGFIMMEREVKVKQRKVKVIATPAVSNDDGLFFLL